MKRIVLAALLGGVGFGFGCSHEARPAAAADEQPPLPPASGSPIGHLVDDAAELKLRDDQLAKLKKIDDELGAKLAASETALRTPDPVPRDNRPDAPRGLGFHAGGGQSTVDQHGTPIGAFPTQGGAQGFPAENTQKQYVIQGSTIDAIYRDRARDTRDAIRRALALLDEAQQVIARRVLTEHGVDPDTGEAVGGEPGVRPASEDVAPLKPAAR
ncbi:MAG TPA: hypothetical protein VHW23_48380 [Kofleriaceae bacterium]|jgi:hypothetical protein|nr:hypothetical protein [Kofleriaceae bacterium]